MAATTRLSITTRWLSWRRMLLALNGLGNRTLRQLSVFTNVLAIMWTAFFLAMTPASWKPITRTIFTRQLLFTAVDGMFVSLRIAAAVGVLIIVQAAMWVDQLGGSTEDIVPTLWHAVVREMAPLIAALVVIGRSCIAISTELAAMLVNGELDVLESQGIDTMTNQIMPRILSVTISVCCLAIVIASTMMAVGYVVGALVDAIRIPWYDYLDTLLRQFSLEDMYFFIPKTIVSGMFIGTICCADGLAVRGTLADVPRVASQSGIHAMTAVFAVSAALSIMIYGRLLIWQLF